MRILTKLVIIIRKRVISTSFLFITHFTKPFALQLCQQLDISHK